MNEIVPIRMSTEDKAKLKERAIIKYINEGIMPSEYEEKYNLINEQEILL